MEKMLFAFHADRLPDWDLQTVVEHAKTWGFDGIELDWELAAASGAIVAQADFKIAAIGCAQMNQIGPAIKLASHLGIGLVKVPSPEMKGKSAALAERKLASWLLPLADEAAAAGVTLAVLNQPWMRTSRQAWKFLEALAHPDVGAAWNVGAAVTAGESALTAMSVLNHKMVCVDLCDGALVRQSWEARRLGEGSMHPQRIIERLRGIGFEGWISIDPSALAETPTLTNEVILVDGIAKLRQWSRPQAVKAKRPDLRPQAK